MKKVYFLFLVAMTMLLFYGCPKGDDEKSNEAEFFMYTSPGDPQIFKAVHPDGTEVIYQGIKDRDGFPLKISSYSVLFPEEDIPHYYELNDEGQITKAHANNGTTFEMNWLSSSKILVTAISPSGELEIKTTVDLSENTDEEKSRQNFENIRKGQSPSIKVKASSTTHDVREAQKAVKGNMSVYLEKCGEAYDKATVYVKLNPWDGGPVQLSNSGDGNYSAASPQVEEPVDFDYYCQWVASSLDLTCNVAVAADPNGICSAIGYAIDGAVGGPTGEAIPITAACLSVWKGVAAYCKTLGTSAADKSIASYLCDKITGTIQNPPEQVTYTATPYALIPGEDNIKGSEQPLSPGGSISWGLNAMASKKIKNFSTSPLNPGPGQGYTASADILCPELNGSKITISVVGSDGYQNSETVTLSQNSAVSLFVPGAEAGVKDTITIDFEGGPKKVISITF